MADYTVKLTDTEDKAMSYSAFSTQDWVENALKNMARRAKDEIVQKMVAYANANDIQLKKGEDAIVNQAFTLKVVRTAKEVKEEAEKKPENEYL